MKLSEKIFLTLPLPFSKWIFNITRPFIFNDARNAGFRKAVNMVKSAGVQGDYLEFGVFKGGSLIQFHNLIEENKLDKIRLFAFDAFQGLPNSEGNTFKEGEFYFPKESFLKRIKKAGVDLKKVIIVEGFFDKSLTDGVKKEHQLNKAAIIHVDCDLYTSTVDVLRFCDGLVQKGTILIFDDYLSFQKEQDASQFGEEKAFKEWKHYPLFEEIYEIGVSKAFVCKANPS